MKQAIKVTSQASFQWYTNVKTIRARMQKRRAVGTHGISAGAFFLFGLLFSLVSLVDNC